MVATDLTANASDQGELPVLLDAVKETFAAQPETVLADAGYCNERDLTDLEKRGIDGYVAPGREGKQTATRDLKAHPATGRMVEELPYRKKRRLLMVAMLALLLEDILSRLTDASHARERGHALFALREIDMFVTTAEFHSAETCADYDAAVAAGRSGQRHLQQAKQRLRRVAAAIQGNALPFDRFGDFQRFYNGVDWYEHASSTDH